MNCERLLAVAQHGYEWEAYASHFPDVNVDVEGKVQAGFTAWRFNSEMPNQTRVGRDTLHVGLYLTFKRSPLANKVFTRDGIFELLGLKGDPSMYVVYNRTEDVNLSDFVVTSLGNPNVFVRFASNEVSLAPGNSGLSFQYVNQTGARSSSPDSDNQYHGWWSRPGEWTRRSRR